MACFATASTATAQTNFFVTAGGGLHKTLNGAEPRPIGDTWFAGVGLNMGKRNGIRLLPKLVTNYAAYRSQLSEQVYYHVWQNTMELQLQSGLPVAKKAMVTAGFFTGWAYHQAAALRHYQPNGYFERDAPESGYSGPQRVQAGIMLGFSQQLFKFKNLHLDCQLKHHALPVFEDNIHYEGGFGPAKTAFAKNARPTSIQIGVRYTLRKHKT